MAYIAGIIDADGYITIAKTKLRGEARKYHVLVKITNTFFPLLYAIQEGFGGSVSTRPAHGNWAGAGWLTIAADQAIALLEAVRPWLRVKAAEAWLALEFAANRKARQGAIIPPGELALREGYYLAIQYACHHRMELVA